MFIPSVSVAFGNRQSAPMRVSLVNLVVSLAEHVGGNRMLDRFVNLALRWPDVGKKHRLAIFTGAERIFPQIHINSPRERERNHQRRRHQVIGADVGLNPPLKIPIPRKYGGNYKVLTINFLSTITRHGS